jgi:transposase
MRDTTISVDVAKSVFEIAVSLHPGHVAETHRLPRPRFASFFAARKPTTVVMEACGMAHHWGRELQSQGHRVVLLPPHAVRPYVPRNKTDRTDAKGILEAFRPALAEACDEIRDLEARIASAEHQLEALARETPVVPVLRSVPGIGLLTATALVAVVDDAARFPSGRHFASFVGLTPRESSTGLRRRLGAISKRGDVYLRILLVHGARSVLRHAKKTGRHDRLRTWALD